MPQFDGLGLTQAQQNLATLVFVIVLGALFAWSWWKGQREPRVTKEFAFSGALTDTQPFRDLAEQFKDIAPRLSAVVTVVEGLARSQTRTAANIDRLIKIVEDYIEDQRSERENDDSYQRGRDDAGREKAVSPKRTQRRAQPRRKPPANT